VKKVIFKGDILFTPTKDKFETYRNSYLVSEEGKIVGVFERLDEKYRDYPIVDYSDKLIIPGFVDIHLHAPQYMNMGLGMDKELIPWLNTYTFPEESRFKDLDYAKEVFLKLVQDLIRHGTTSAVVYSSIHKDTTKLLMDLFIESKLRAYVGKVNMDRNANTELKEDTEKSLRDTEEIILEYRDKSPLVKPIITPRFVPSCTEELMKGLGELALKYDVPVQSHLNENRGEIQWVEELHPQFPNYSSVYDHFSLFGQTKTIMAHCIYNKDEEIDLMAERGVYAAHCADSNFNLSSGIMPVRKYLDKGVNVGLGSDISGGHSLSIPRAIVGTIQASKMKWLETNRELKPISCSEAFYMATKGGGSFFGKVGSFEEGYETDLLVVDDSNINDIERLTLEERIERFLYVGDYRNIVERYVAGERIEVLSRLNIQTVI